MTKSASRSADGSRRRRASSASAFGFFGGGGGSSSVPSSIGTAARASSVETSGSLASAPVPATKKARRSAAAAAFRRISSAVSSRVGTLRDSFAAGTFPAEAWPPAAETSAPLPSRLLTRIRSPRVTPHARSVADSLCPAAPRSSSPFNDTSTSDSATPGPHPGRSASTFAAIFWRSCASVHVSGTSSASAGPDTPATRTRSLTPMAGVGRCERCRGFACRFHLLGVDTLFGGRKPGRGLAHTTTNPCSELETVCTYKSTFFFGFFFSTHRSRSTEVTPHGRARRSPARSQSRAKSACAGASTAYQSLPRANAPSACARTRDPPIDRPLTSQPRPIPFFLPSQWLPDPEPPRT